MSGQTAPSLWLSTQWPCPEPVKTPGTVAEAKQTQFARHPRLEDPSQPLRSPVNDRQLGAARRTEHTAPRSTRVENGVNRRPAPCPPRAVGSWGHQGLSGGAHPSSPSQPEQVPGLPGGGARSISLKSTGSKGQKANSLGAGSSTAKAPSLIHCNLRESLGTPSLRRLPLFQIVPAKSTGLTTGGVG